MLRQIHVSWLIFRQDMLRTRQVCVTMPAASSAPYRALCRRRAWLHGRADAAGATRAGRDPKPWPPPFKLSREMVEAMGGAESEHYRAFCAHACEAYNILRKSASLILSLFHLMAGAAIPDIRSDPEKAMLKLQARARLALPI